MPRFTHLSNSVILSAIAVLILLPAIWHGVFDAMDLQFHLRWTEQFSEQFWNGDRYPRWLQNMNAGLGSPAFFFYAPAPFYFTSLFSNFFSAEARQWGQLSSSIVLAMIASGFTVYLWLQQITNRRTALIGSLLYMALPYHLGVNLYWRFAFAEYWALVWLPLILYFTHKLIHQSKSAIAGLSVSYALLIMTHLPTLVMFAPVSIAYVLINQVKAFWKVAISLTLAIALSAIYLLPALMTQDAISMNAIREGGYLYSNNFLFSRKFLPYHNPYFWMYLEGIAVGMIAIATCAFTVTAKQRESRFWFGVSIVSFLMTTPISQPIWAILPALQRIQFPWRFNAVLLVSVTALIAIALAKAKIFQSLRPLHLRKVSMTIGVLLTTGLLLTNIGAMKLRLKPIDDPQVIRAIQIHKETALEYRPKWVAPEFFTNEAIANLAKLPQNESTIRQWKPRELVFQSKTQTESWITLRQFYYPGWFAYTDSKKLDVQPAERTGLLQVKVPAGLHQVQVKLGQSSSELAGRLISAIALLIWGALICTLAKSRAIAFSLLGMLGLCAVFLYFSIW
ncbi:MULTISPECIES: 6-pyruvoyl-tetrahydropterin synthase-related protein [Leptolyngbya]|uniref:6-pyruvoyl-tetrahydropterin synthase-related protein n=1 Tax=Leptolyngbya TaxID=47251 RepID=UPI001686B320|nr:6-pyruvoyl-tetrahydropterin synthase-related protein [Leptolyngbya sp. FACHB-1624]MBD1857189.1 hypothetical protein [Leptolyngbya sp. FACHB-1624]